MDKLCKTTDIPTGTMKGFTAIDHQFLVANVGGAFYAIDAVCSHRGGFLPSGRLEKTTVICPVHGAQFDVTTGRVTKDVPMMIRMATGGAKDLKSFKTTVKDGFVLVDVNND